MLLIVHPDNIETGKQFGLRHKFTVFASARYLGGLNGDGDSKRDWLQYRTSKWKKNIHTIRKVAGKYLQ